MEALGAFLRRCNKGSFEFDAESLGASENVYQQGHLSQTGPEIDKDIGWRKRTGSDEVQDMANRSGLIRDGLRDRTKIRFGGFAELQNAGAQIIQVVIGQAWNWKLRFVMAG